MRRVAATLALPLLLAPLACPRAPRATTDPKAPCASLEDAACRRARALTLVAATYADEQHDYVLASPGLSAGAALDRTRDGWRTLPLACARRGVVAPPKLDPAVVEYAFVGVAVDATLVSADADLGALLARTEPQVHDVRLVALAFVRDAAPQAFDSGASLVETPSGGCACGDATHFAGESKYGAMLSYGLRVPRQDGHVRAVDFIRAALGDPRRSVRESRAGTLVVDGLGDLLAGSAVAPLTFHVLDAVPIAFAAQPVAELCDFPAPEVSPSPLDFGIAPYGTEARRTVHVVNRSPIDLHALLGADTFVLPAHGAIDLPLRWTPDGDAPGCETQTRDEVIPFLRATAAAPVPRVARVLETIRTGRPTVEHVEHLEATGLRPDYAQAARDWTCPRDFVRTSCRADNAVCADGRGCRSGGYAVTAEPRGEGGCHFACTGPATGAPPPFCRFDAAIECALHCGR